MRVLESMVFGGGPVAADVLATTLTSSCDCRPV